MGLLSVSEVNELSGDQFERVFGNVIELCTDAAVQLKDKRPFGSSSEICDAFCKYLDDISVEVKLVILKLHPDLAGRLAAQGELTRESANEQRSAGLNDISVEQKRMIDQHNQRLTPEQHGMESDMGYCLTQERRYKLKFGFPFIICARENKVQSIIEGLQRRYNNSKEREINTGIDEVKKICTLRILDIVRQ